ncbi:MAG: hypothetical protein ACQEVA_02930 [Myxococcota bacterium]
MGIEVRTALVGGLLVLGCAACGEDGGDEPEPNDPTQPELSFEEVEPNDTYAQATPIEVGSRMTGVIEQSSGEPDVDLYQFEARAGTIVAFGVESTGAGLEDEVGAPQVRLRLRNERGDYLRDLFSDLATTREAYTLLSGTYYLEVRDLPSALEEGASLGGPDATYSVTLVESDWRTRPLIPPGSTRDNWVNRGVDGFTFKAEGVSNYVAETTAQREPVGGDLDTTISVWDATDGRLVGSNDDVVSGAEPTLDSRVSFSSVPQHEYIVIVDPLQVVRDPAAIEYNTEYDVSVSLGR